MLLLTLLLACDSGPPPEPVPKIAMEGRFALPPPADGAGVVIGTWLSAAGDVWVVGVQAGDGSRTAFRVSRELDPVHLEAPPSLPKGAWFGMDGLAGESWVVIGAPGTPDGEKPGTLEVFSIQEDGWAWDRRIDAPDGGTAAFGLRVAGDASVVVAPDKEAGVVHMIDPATWEITQTMTPSANPITTAAVSGDTLLLGAPAANTVVILSRGDEGWTEAGTVTGAGSFGHAVAIEGARAVVGAPSADGGEGRVHIYDVSGGSLTEIAALGPDPAGTGAHLGTTVAILGEAVLAGAPAEMGPSGSVPGKVEGFAACNGTWDHAATFAGVGSDGDGFGAAIAVSGDTLIAASPHATGSGGRRGRVDGMRVRSPRCVVPQPR